MSEKFKLGVRLQKVKEYTLESLEEFKFTDQVTLLTFKFELNFDFKDGKDPQLKTWPFGSNHGHFQLNT